MDFRRFISLLFLLFLFMQPASADCKYFKNKDGFPLGIVPTPSSIVVDFLSPEEQSRSFLLYIEAEAGTTTSLDCRVSLEVVNESFALAIELSNYSLETGLGFTEKPISITMTPTNLVNFPDMIESYIKIKDVDNPDNYALLPVRATFKFQRSKPQPSITPSPSPTKSAPTAANPSPSIPPSNGTSITDIIQNAEDSNQKYVIAIVAFFFLAALLWMGFNSLQRD
ncbi:MAG: hypothetical protein ABH863_05330 [Candidatus Micrarchaeota archaeon]